ncbi:VCBS repeat-containing protein [Cognatishimia sp. WU-CL00825]|uniref:FG-GAP repeat domain-containing protein n=1 Tax=Cognatishimia sp. WU-CL00825 TaxID=3127658 RepID=UPI0033654A63
MLQILVGSRTACRATRGEQLWSQPLGLAVILTLALFGQTASADITSARYTDPTTRYAHGVLGDTVEWGTLELRLSNGARRRLVLPKNRVFEDLSPRLVDVDGDNAPEVIVVESSQTEGARLAIYGADGLIAATPFIGQRNRWLAPVGAADLDGDGLIEIAYVDRPHLAKTLRVWRFKNTTLTQIATQKNITNHRIGQDFITGGIRDCGQRPEMVVLKGDWSQVLSLSLSKQGQLKTKVLGSFEGPDSVAQLMRCP